jgi:glycogen synthase
MRILQLIYESLHCPFGFGGAGVRAYEIYRRLRPNHDVTLLCMKYPGARDGETEGLRHVYVGAESLSLPKSVIAYTFGAARYVKQHAGEYHIIVENFLPSTPFFSQLLSRTPVVLQVQGILESHALKKFRLFYGAPMFLVEHFYPRLYDRFIFVSPVTERKVMGRIGTAGRTSQVIPNGVGDDLFAAKKRELDYILFFSRLDIYTKGLDILARAFGTVARTHPGVRLVIAGYQFDPFEKVRMLCPPDVRDRVEYAGFLTGQEKLDLLSGASVAVLPSRHESSPVSILEAAACGKPVLVSDIPELTFVRDQGFGVCFESGSAESLAAALTGMLDDHSLRNRLGEAGRAFAREFTWDAIAARYEEALLRFASSPLHR